MPDVEADAVVNAAMDGDESAFGVLAQRHRRELHVHCYRMLGSFEEAEDVVQEVLLRAWRNRASFEGASGFRAWLYKIATNASLDAIRSRKRRLHSLGSFAEVPWLQPYPDRLLDEIPADDETPDAVAVAKETIELAFLAAVQLLPPLQRAVLIVRDVLGWSAADTAAMLETTVPAVNSASQRARATLRTQLPARRADWSVAEPSSEERELLQRFIDAHERADIPAAVAMLREDVRVTMPPNPWLYDGIDALLPLMVQAIGPEPMGEWRLVPTWANRMPAAVSYLRAKGDTEFRALKLDVLRIEDGLIAEITTFEVFSSFGLPPTL